MMKLAEKHTKSAAIYNEIEKQISTGKLKAGERIQSVRKIANHFSSSISVVQTALRNLENGNFLEAKHGSGTFVKAARFKSSSRNIFLSLPEGHVFGELAFKIRNLLIERGFVPISVDYSQMVSMTPDSSFQKNVDEILGSGLKSVILFGNSYWRYPFIEKHPELNAVFLCNVDYSGKDPDRAVLLDYEKAFYLAASHLAASGRKKIMLCTFKPDPKSLSDQTVTRHHSTQIACGYDRALKEYDIASYRKIFYRSGVEINESLLKELLNSEERPDSIVCDQDHEAMLFVSTALRLGIKIPEDLAVTGCYNTPWSELSPVKITSVTFDWTRLAEESVRLALEENPSKTTVYIKPELIVRESSRKGKN